MVPRELFPIIFALIALYLVLMVFSFFWIRRTRQGIHEKDTEVKHRLYELAILKEISDRTGYSLNIQKILDVIMGSLNQFLEYSAVSYMLLEPAKVVFKADLDQSVSPQFIKEIRSRMLGSLTALLGRDLSDIEVDETITGAIMLDETEEPVRSYFNIPLVIGGELKGVLTISHTKAGLYKESEMEILYKIVNQASRAVTKLEEVVKMEQGKISAMLESMTEGVIMTDCEYHVITANPVARAAIGYKKEGTPPTIFDFIDALGEVFDIKNKLEEAIKLGKIITDEEVIYNNKYYKVVVSPVKSNVGLTKGQTLGAVVLFHDISHEKEVEKMRKDFTSMMVHELRSPLGNIKKIGELMRSSKILESKKTANEYAGMLYDSSSSMLELVNDLLDVAKLEAGKFDVSKQPASIEEVLTERVNFFDQTAKAKNINLKLQIQKNFSQTSLFDSKRITQVVNNLLSNAINYTAQGGTVTVSCFVHKDMVDLRNEAKSALVPWVDKNMRESSVPISDSIVVVVTDTGEGIAPENIAKLFSKFTQFSIISHDHEHKGTGLGLVIVKGIVEAHGGVVGLGSKQGTGSTFYFTIPL